MYVAVIPNRGAQPTILVRESYREDGRVKNRTLANLTHLPAYAVEGLQRLLKGEKLVTPEDVFEIERSVQHGHVDAVLRTIRRIGLDKIIAKKRSPERDLVLAMIVGRILSPSSKLETTRWWSTTSLPEKLGIVDADENALYSALDWLLEQQPAIEKRLAARHLNPGELAMYDITSTWVEGAKCPLAALGYSRDGRRDKKQIVFGMLTDEVGRPVAVSVYPGNTTDSTTVRDQINKLKNDFDLDLIVFVGDRGMVTQVQIDTFMEEGGVEWITALKSGAIRKLKTEGSLQIGLFDKRNLFEFQSPEYPGERFIACRNPELAERRARTRKDLIDATKRELEKVRKMVKSKKLRTASEIGIRVGRVVNKFKVAKLFKLEIRDGELKYRVLQDKVKAESALDGIYVIRTSVSKEVFSAEDTVRHYKRLTHIERGFRSIKTVSQRVRPIYHHLEPRVRAHIFLCMLAYYVEWHMRQAWSEMLFADETDTVEQRDPVVRAQPSTEARQKAASKRTRDGSVAHSFRSLLNNLSTIVKNFCRRKDAPENEPRIDMVTQPNALQARALELIDAL